MPPNVLSANLFAVVLCPGESVASKVYCTKCHAGGVGKEYKWRTGQGTGTLLDHYQRAHKREYDKYLRLEEVQSVTSKRSASEASVSSIPSATPDGAATQNKKQRVEQLSLRDAFSVAGNANVVQKMALFFANNRIAYNVADSSSFIDFIAAVRASTRTLPRRDTLAREVSSLADQMRERLWAHLRSAATPVAIAIDGWTNVQQTKITNILLISNGVAFYWCSISNPHSQNTAQWLHDHVKPKLQELHEGGVRFASFIADNEAANGKLFRLLRVSFPFLIKIPCATHTIQLAVKRVMKCDRWAAVRLKVEDILHNFSINKDARLKLKNRQAGEEKEYRLVKPNDTRWNSHLYAAQRLIKLRPFVDICFKQSSEFWSEVEKYIAFLQPFQVATDVVQRDTSTLFDVFLQWNMLSRHVATESDAKVRHQLKLGLKKRWSQHVNTAATIASALLSLEMGEHVREHAREEDIEDAKRFIVEFGSQYISFFKLSKLSVDELEGRLMTQIGQFSDRVDRFQRFETDIQLTKRSAGTSWTPLNVWAMYNMELSVVARALLNTPSSEAAVERSFSLQGAIHTKLHNRLLDRKVEQEMFVSFNHGPLHGDVPVRAAPKVSDLHVEFMSAEVGSDDDTDNEVEDYSEKDEEMQEQPAAEAQHSERDDSGDDQKDQSVSEAERLRHRTQSAINHDNAQFLHNFIKRHNVTLQMTRPKWPQNLVNTLEGEALSDNPGGYSTKQLQAQIVSILNSAGL